MYVCMCLCLYVCTYVCKFGFYVCLYVSTVYSCMYEWMPGCIQAIIECLKEPYKSASQTWETFRKDVIQDLLKFKGVDRSIFSAVFRKLLFRFGVKFHISTNQVMEAQGLCKNRIRSAEVRSGYTRSAEVSLSEIKVRAAEIMLSEIKIRSANVRLRETKVRSARSG